MNTIGMTACMPTATAHRPSPVTRPPTKLIAPIMRSRGRPWKRDLDRDGREHRQRKTKGERPSLLAPGRRQIGDAGRYRAEGGRLTRGKAKNCGSDERDRDDPEADARAVDNVLADKKPREILGARPARHEGPEEF